MKRLLLSICMMFLLMNVTGCSLFSNGDNAGQVNSEIEQFVIQTTVG